MAVPAASSSRWSAIALCMAAILSHHAQAEDWTITTADLLTQPATAVTGLGNDGVQIAVPGASAKTIPLDQFVSAHRSFSPAPAIFMLLLNGGDRLTGEPTGVVGETLSWKNSLLGPSQVPLNRLVAMVRDGTSIPAARPHQDIVTLSNADTVAGVVTDCNGSTVSLQTDNGPVQLPLASVTRILFAATAAPATQAAADPHFRLRFDDGSIATAHSAGISGDMVHFQSIDSSAAAVPIVRLAGLEQLDGPLAWLSQLQPIESVQIPFFGSSITWPAQFDAAVDGAPIEVDDRRYDRGIGVHAYSKLVFAIDPAWSAFRTQYAVDWRRDAPLPLAEMTLRISLDGRIAYQQQHVRAGQISPIVMLDLNHARTLTLEADYGDAADVQDRLNWIEPALLRSRLATTRPATSP